MSTPFGSLRGDGGGSAFQDDVPELRAIGDAMREAGTGADLPVSASDDTGTVSITMTGRGEVQDVLIDSDWLRTVGPSGLGEALMTAHQFATGESAADAIQRVVDAMRSDRPTAARPADVDAWPDVVEPTREERYARIERLQREIGQLERQLAERDHQTSVAGSAGVVRIDLDGGRIVGIRLDRRRAAELPADRLAAEALSAFRAASPPRPVHP